MAFKTQKLVNKFPRWTKIRRDPSSFGSRMFSVFADYFDFRGGELVKLRDELNLQRLHLGRGTVWKLTLEDDDELPVVITTGGITTWTYPTTVTGVFSTGTKTLSRVETLEELLWPVPDEVVLAETITPATFTLWQSSSPTTYNTITNPDRLMIVVENSTDYFRRTRYKNRSASGWHMLIIKGKDINGQTFTEYLPVSDDGVFWTRNIISELEEITTEGFDGDVTVYVNSPITSTRMMVDYYHIGSTDSDEGPLKLSLDTSVLGYYIQRVKRGANYRTGDGDVIDNTEIVWEQALADEAGTALADVVDIAINWDTGRLYSVTDGGDVYVYEHGLTPFTPFVDEDLLTLDVFIEIQPLKHWANLNDTMTFYTWFRKPRYAIAGVTIKRRDPSGNVEYLQSNYTWSGSTYEFPGADPANKLPEETWKDLTFTNLFDEYGQWEFYVTTRAVNGTTTVDASKVMVDKLTAEAVYATGLGPGVTGIYFSEDGRLHLHNATTIWKFDEHGHVYLANGSSQQLFFRENYTSVEVTP